MSNEVSDLPDNLVSHRASWLKAFDRLIELEPENPEPDMDERGYWRHERQAMIDMYAALDRRSPSPRIETRASEDDGVSYAGKVHAAEAPMATAIDDVKEGAFEKEMLALMVKHLDPNTLGRLTYEHGPYSITKIRNSIMTLLSAVRFASPAPSQHTGWSDEAVDRPLLLEAIKGLMLLKDLFDSSDGTPADAYHILAKQDGTWGNARTALTAASTIAPATGFEVLKPDMMKALPGGVLDDSTYEQIENALDAVGAAMCDADGRFMTLAERIRSSISPSASGFQDRVAAAHVALFHDDPTDLAERRDRFGEEANEVQQALGQTREDAHRLVDYTYDRPAGEPEKEIGAAALTLASLCVVGGWDMMACAEADLAKLVLPETIARIRAKRSTRHGRGPLPGVSPSVAKESGEPS